MKGCGGTEDLLRQVRYEDQPGCRGLEHQSCINSFFSICQHSEVPKVELDFLFFFLNDPAPPEISPLPLHAALRISPPRWPPPPWRTRGTSTLRSDPSRRGAWVGQASKTSPTHRRRPCARPWCWRETAMRSPARSEEHTSELQSQSNLVCRLLLEKKK